MLHFSPYRSRSSILDKIPANGVRNSWETTEIKRVLKPGGKAIFIEPLPYNPVINVYRKMATEHRSKDENPLSISQIKKTLKPFSHGTHKEFWIFTLIVFCWMYLIEKIHPNDVQYWKKIIYDAEHYRFVYYPLLFVDYFLTRLPFVRWMSWTTVLMVEK